MRLPRFACFCLASMGLLCLPVGLCPAEKPRPKTEISTRKEISTELGKMRKNIEEKKAEKPRYWVNAKDLPFLAGPDNRTGVKILIDSNRVGPTLVSLQRITLLPGGAIARRACDSACIFYVLEGKMEFKLADFPAVTLGPEGALMVPPQGIVEIKNPGATGVTTILQFFSPAGPEQEYRTWENAFKEQREVAPE